ncbi:MAG: response regulator [Sandaracinaceae bacterium]
MAVRVLVVEDDPALARLAEKMLAHAGIEVHVHERGFGVLQRIATCRPHVLLLDVMLPGLDGPELVELIRGDPELSRTRVVLWSALSAADLTKRARLCGADGSIEKAKGPFHLVAQITDWLRVWDGVDLKA